ncbi:tyrosine-type recombinase/integrase [Salibacterium qingdaonense]|uniref:Site-specific recombinase XerD n=1 Tax=Salibacterium qingdaonense TaxID=266892 RepID=A0A1I4QVA0_9BACI|nr:site-specific integrase [Salibacterium qingdaonense]SFM43927.1 Site-specific recombinase XerD [Salibacterium qingdaonense]
MRGHIRKRGNKYAIVVDVGYDDRGKRKQKWFSGYSNKTDAEKDLPGIVAKLQEGSFIEPTKATVSEFLNEWLKIRQSDLSSNTYDSYCRQVQNHIIPSIGQIPLSKLRAMHVQRMMGELEKKNLSKTSIHKAYSVLKAALKYAYKTDMIAVNIVDKLDNPKKGEKEMSFWTREEAKLFLERAKNEELYIFFHLALSTGMRPGEILGLKWSDIHPEKKTLHVTRSLTRQMHFKSPKTSIGKRYITLDDDTVSHLKAHRTKQKEHKMRAGKSYEDNNLVIATKLGKPVGHRNVLRTWYRIIQPLVQQEKVKEIRMYDLRHTHASMMLSEGVHSKIVSERLGHASVRTTLDVYSHITPGIQEEAADKIGSILK